PRRLPLLCKYLPDPHLYTLSLHDALPISVLQLHHVSRQDRPKLFVPRYRDRPHVPDTMENHVPVYAQSAGAKTVLKWQDHNDEPAAQQALWRYKEVWHMRLAEYLLRP